MRIGAFRGGMSDVLISPLVRAIRSKGGEVRAGVKVTGLRIEDGRVAGVDTESGPLNASHVVVAAPLPVAKQWIRAALPDHEWFRPMLSLDTLSAATIQFELHQPVFETDHTNFSPTAMCCFAEQSHTTFADLPGRLSVILYPPERYLDLAPEQIAEQVYLAAEELGIGFRDRVKRYRIAHHPHDFYALSPGNESKRPRQKTPVPGLSLAGDYTKQPFVATMEGAVLSGQAAAEAISW